jgi:LysM repeat protein
VGGGSSSSGSDEEGPLARRVITVEAGDTMEGLAARHNVSVMDLRRHNRQLFPLGEPVVLCEGMHLVVYHRQHQ